MTVARSLTAVCLAAISLLAQARSHSPAERFDLFQQYLVRRAAETTRSSPGDIKTLDEWKRIRPRLRQQVLYMLGLVPMPAKTPLEARITGTLDRGSYTIEKVVFQSMPGLYVTGNLYLPKSRPGPLPTVLYLCGHSPGPWGAKVDYQHHGIWFARNGYVALLIDTIEFGEVPGIHHGTHDLEMWDWLSLGYTPAGPETWNAIRAVDYLETRPEVDRSRIAVTGISGGGAITWYAAAVDERLQVAASVCATWTVEHHTALDAVHENCDCIYFHNTFLADLPVVGALIAPRPLKIISARRDPSFPSAGYREVYRRLRPIYELYGAGDRIVEYDHDAPHADLLPFRKEANEWINRWLRKDATPFEEGDIKREPPETLKVLDRYPPGAVNGHVHRIFIPCPRPRIPKTLEQWKTRRAVLIAELKDKSFRAFRAEKVPFDTWKRESQEWTAKYARPFDVEFSTEANVRVTGHLYLPREEKPSHPGLIYVKGRQDVVYPIDYDPLLPVLGTHVVLTLQPRAVDYPMDNYKTATIKRTAALVGATLESMQTWDILRAVDFLVEGERLALSSLSVYARKDMAVPTLYAAALDSRISAVILDDPPASHWQGPALLNVLRFTDLSEVAAAIAPRELVSLGRMPDDYRLAESVYGLYKTKQRMRRAHALADALKVWETP